MRSLPALAVVVAMLAASPLASAQRASLGERVAALEARAAGDQGATELVNQLGLLRAEVQALRGEIEQLQQQLEQARQSQRSQYLDLDGRIDRLEGGGAATAQPREDAPAAPAAPAVQAGAMAAMDERGAYGHAFDALREGDYAESARRFQAFLAVHPGGTLAPNARYWLGESYYVTENYALAAQQFQALLERHAEHDKAAGALLKLGLSQYGLKQYPEAEATLREVLRRHPGSDVAATAEDRLRAMQLAGNR